MGAHFGAKMNSRKKSYTTVCCARTSEIHCPLMFHFGEEDTNPSLEDMRQLDAALTHDHKEHVSSSH